LRRVPTAHEIGFPGTQILLGSVTQSSLDVDGYLGIARARDLESRLGVASIDPELEDLAFDPGAGCLTTSSAETFCLGTVTVPPVSMDDAADDRSETAGPGSQAVAALPELAGLARLGVDDPEERHQVLLEFHLMSVPVVPEP